MDDGAGSYRRFRNGEEKAFDELMEGYFPSLVFFVNRYVHDFHAAEDIAMDAFADLIVHPHRYRPGTAFKTYLFMLGRSRALDYLRHKRSLFFTELTEAETLPDEKQLEEELLREEKKRLVNDAMACLPEEMRIAVHLVFFEELSYEETAKVMKKNKKQVDNLLYRAKKELRTRMGGKGETCL